MSDEDHEICQYLTQYLLDHPIKYKPSYELCERFAFIEYVKYNERTAGLGGVSLWERKRDMRNALDYFRTHINAEEEDFINLATTDIGDTTTYSYEDFEFQRMVSSTLAGNYILNTCVRHVDECIKECATFCDAFAKATSLDWFPNCNVSIVHTCGLDGKPVPRPDSEYEYFRCCVSHHKSKELSLLDTVHKQLTEYYNDLQTYEINAIQNRLTGRYKSWYDSFDYGNPKTWTWY